MKVSGIIKFLLVLLLIMIVGLVGMYSWGSKTFKYNEEIRVNTVRQDVYKHLTQPELIEQWLGGVEEVKPIDEEGNALLDAEGEEVNVATDIAGARALVLVNADGQEFEMTSEVLNSSFGHTLETRVDSDMMTAVIRYKLTDVRVDDQPLKPDTRIEQEMEVQYKGISRFFGPFAGASIQAKLKEDLEALKKLAESGEALAAFNEQPERFAVNKEEIRIFEGESNFSTESPPPAPGSEPKTDDDNSDDDNSDDDASDDD